MKKLLFFTVIITTIVLTACKKNDTQTMPDDFAISFSYGINSNQMNILDSYKGTIQKDLIWGGVATVDYLIKKDDLNKIYSKLNEFKIYEIESDMTSSNLATGNNTISIEPCTKYNMSFTINGIDYNVTGDVTSSYYKNEQANHFYAFITYMTKYIESTEEYKSLPKVEGGYD